MKKQALSVWIAGALIVAAALSRLLPHPYNFSPVAAIALLGGAAFRDRRLAFLLPLGALLLSDLCFALFTGTPGFYGWPQVMNYAAFLLIVLLGTRLLRHLRVKNVLLGSLSASLLFFLLSNLGVWLFTGGQAPYTHDGAGLIATYTLAIPFLGNTIIGDLFYCIVLFGGYALARYFIFRRREGMA
ncbi:DUF6580 family putative transport protein [Compostibacter hankyongensis]|uniref:DUF6580 family putative transport protein n=1 Tax=Compostibacter hankyongensis TaxID=1007089 RepID=UPI0031E70DC6